MLISGRREASPPMSMPFYVSPEQLMKDRADFARKGIARGRSVAVVRYADGVLFVSENPSAALHKISEIYDRIAFAAVGRYNEFENLRIAGVRLADMRGYSYDRRDVTGRGLANAYAQTLGTIFSSGGEKPYEIEIFVAEVGDVADDDQIFRLTFDGQVVEEHDYAVMGGAAEAVTTYLKERYTPGLSRNEALVLAAAALGQNETGHRDIPARDLEVAVLDRTRTQERKFKRMPAPVLVGILGDQGSRHLPPRRLRRPRSPRLRRRPPATSHRSPRRRDEGVRATGSDPFAVTRAGWVGRVRQRAAARGPRPSPPAPPVGARRSITRATTNASARKTAPTSKDCLHAGHDVAGLGARGVHGHQHREAQAAPDLLRHLQQARRGAGVARLDVAEHGHRDRHEREPRTDAGQHHRPEQVHCVRAVLVDPGQPQVRGADQDGAGHDQRSYAEALDQPRGDPRGREDQQGQREEREAGARGRRTRGPPA